MPQLRDVWHVTVILMVLPALCVTLGMESAPVMMELVENGVTCASRDISTFPGTQLVYLCVHYT